MRLLIASFRVKFNNLKGTRAISRPEDPAVDKFDQGY